MHAFRKRCVHNNFLLVEYIERLSSFGGKIGNARVKLYEDFAKKEAIEDVPENCGGNSDFIVSKCDPRTLDCKGGATRNEFAAEVVEDFEVFVGGSDSIGNRGEISEDSLLSTTGSYNGGAGPPFWRHFTLVTE